MLFGFVDYYVFQRRTSLAYCVLCGGPARSRWMHFRFRLQAIWSKAVTLNCAFYVLYVRKMHIFLIHSTRSSTCPDLSSTCYNLSVIISYLIPLCRCLCTCVSRYAVWWGLYNFPGPIGRCAIRKTGGAWWLVVFRGTGMICLPTPLSVANGLHQWEKHSRLHDFSIAHLSFVSSGCITYFVPSVNNSRFHHHKPIPTI